MAYAWPDESERTECVLRDKKDSYLADRTLLCSD